MVGTTRDAFGGSDTEGGDMSARPVVVIGDALLDVDLRGESHRRSPDAAAPVLDEPMSWFRPGGAALAARLLHEYDGTDVVLVTALGQDSAAEELANGLGSGVTLVALPLRDRTPTKTRVQTGGATIARVDEGCEPTGQEADGADVRRILRGATAVLVSDYGLGLTRQNAVREALAEAAEHVPVVWDPHPRGAPPISGTRMVTPNEDEARVGEEQGSGTRRARRLTELWRVGAVTITLGKNGATWYDSEGESGWSRATSVTESGDTCGAGDAFASACTAVLARGADTSEAVDLGTRAASSFVADGAAAAYAKPRGVREPSVNVLVFPPAVERARSRGERVVATGGCFDVLHAGHVDLLHRARALGDHLIVLINSDASVEALKGPGRPVVPGFDRARVVAALACVDTVVLFDDLTPVETLARIRPDVWVKGGDYDPEELPETAVVRGAGGEVVTMPLLTGRSTSGLINRIREHEDTPAGHRPGR